MQSSQEPEDQCLFRDVGAAQHLVHVHRAYPRDFADVQRSLYSARRRALTQRVDQDCRVKQQRQLSADTARVAEALSSDPAGRVGIPLVLLPGEGSQPSLDVFTAARIVERSAQRICDEGAATPPADTLVELLDEFVLEAYVQSHGPQVSTQILSGLSRSAARLARHLRRPPQHLPAA